MYVGPLNLLDHYIQNSMSKPRICLKFWSDFVLKPQPFLLTLLHFEFCVYSKKFPSFVSFPSRQTLMHYWCRDEFEE